jgi:hypothetical protein
VSFGIYLVGFLILIAGLGWGAFIMHVPGQWIGVGLVVLAGFGIVMGVKATRQKESAN